jgi:Flp pilus assembly protein TadG
MRKKRLSSLWAATEGLGAIEFGFVAPVLLAMLLGVLDFGMAFWQKMEIATAADAGAIWGMSNSYNESSIRSVVQAATSLSIPAGNIGPSNPCGCATSTGITTGYGTPPSCTACPDATTAKPYIVVNAHICYSTLFPSWPGLTYGGDGCSSNQISLTAQAFVLK